MNRWHWTLIAVVLYGIGDITTTLIGLNNGFTEANPLFAVLNNVNLLQAFAVLVVAKVVSFGLFEVLHQFTERVVIAGNKLPNIIYPVVSFSGLVIVIHNINVIYL